MGLLHRVRQPFNVNAVAQWAALAALEDQEHVRRSLDVNRQGMEYLTGEIANLGLEWVPSSANFILLRVGNGNDVFQQLLAQASHRATHGRIRVSGVCEGHRRYHGREPEIHR